MKTNAMAIGTILATDRKVDTLFRQLNMDNGITTGHSKGVNQLANLFAEKLPFLTERDQLFLDWGSKLHDLGKLEVGAGILLKKDKLTMEEYIKIRKHPLAGFQKAQAAGMPREVTEIILYHHERFDGTGYPFGLAGKEIPVLAGICSVLDAFEAMVSDRPYRERMTYEAAFNELLNQRGTQFAPEIVDSFLELKSLIMEQCHF